MQIFKDIRYWIFDLDNTLYPRHCDLFSQIDILMTQYVSNLTGFERDEARKLQKDLYRDYGTTLRGLMETHKIDPHGFLDTVHDIDYSILPKNPQLNELLSTLPGKKYIYTNGSVSHAENTLGAMDVKCEIFDGIFDIIASDFEPKPHPAPFEKFMKMFDINPNSAAMFEDLPRNLQTAKQFGLATVLVLPDEMAKVKLESWESVKSVETDIDYSTSDLPQFLQQILGMVIDR